MTPFRANFEPTVDLDHSNQFPDLRGLQDTMLWHFAHAFNAADTIPISPPVPPVPPWAIWDKMSGATTRAMRSTASAVPAPIDSSNQYGVPGFPKSEIRLSQNPLLTSQ